MATLTHDRERIGDVNLMMTSRVRGTPMQCTQAILDEIEGRSQWWKPYVLLRHRPATPHEEVGCIIDVIANPSGHTERLVGTTRWSLRLDALEPGARVDWSLVDGHYRGWMEWTFEGARLGATRVSVRGHLSPHGWNRVRAMAWDEIFEVTRLLRRGFDGMSRHLATLAPPEPSHEGDDDSDAFGDEEYDDQEHHITHTGGRT